MVARFMLDGAKTYDLYFSDFRWPAHINAFAASTEHLEPFGADLWTIVNTLDDNFLLLPPLASRRPGLPEWMILTPPKVSCRYSHVSAIRQFIDRGNATPEDAAVFLEDDIDMEKDIDLRMRHVWNSLPPAWDMVFLASLSHTPELDQAFSWLIESGRLRAFSIVPSVVVQRKLLFSDVFPGSGVGSAWREKLVDGVFET
ncbi:hypothetical protein AZE42_08384 [Rhizopogon vesiculosus]|uniref:Glycosyltransferase family 25 protein n=1 Tax=Rhizopogon vesiculosus TaxID=180088 RepID=A0A1J8QFJ5_9AGAM|nr:hypothetical protein AZE42_08384 [Rhizopogon vesiculosus]